MKKRAEVIAERLAQVFKSKKGIEEIFVDIMINNNLQHRLLVAKKYGEKNKNPLYEDIKAKLGGCFKELFDLFFNSHGIQFRNA